MLEYITIKFPFFETNILKNFRYKGILHTMNKKILIIDDNKMLGKLLAKKNSNDFRL